jgi:hypothetical protein
LSSPDENQKNLGLMSRQTQSGKKEMIEAAAHQAE